MNTAISKYLGLSIILLAGRVSLAAEDLKAPAVALFEAAAKGDTTAVVKSFAELPSRSADKAIKEGESVVAYVRKTQDKKEVLDLQKVDEDLGVVVFLDKPNDPDPIYMQKQQGTWRILSIGDYEPKQLGFDESKLARLEALKAWFKQEKQTIRAQRKK